jgi:excisionase family DNA binding protein
MTYTVDVTVALEQLRAELRDELRAELRAEAHAATWPRWMSVDTLARYIDASPQRIRKLVARRAIPFVQEAPGCRVFFDRQEIDRWMAGSHHEPKEGGA